MDESLPLMDDPYALSAEATARYQEDGHILLRSVASSREIAAFRPVFRDVMAEKKRERDAQGRPGGYATYFQQVTNLWRLDERLQRFVFARRFAGIAARLMGVHAVRLYHDQALFKPARGKGTPWHQDQFYWPLDTSHTITMWMPLIDLTEEMGTMVFATGSHRDGPLLPQAISEEADRSYEELVHSRGFPLTGSSLNAGDATFHSGWTLHASHANRSDVVREAMTIIYFADGARIVEPDTEYRKADLAAFHPGQRPGEVAGSPLNPLLFQE